VEITPEEETAAKIAILLHDIGHGPFSHALENVLITDTHHETISILIMRVLNEQMKGQLHKAIDIFTNNYTKPFLHQLISGQFDVDRMDYLTRDSFYTGVSEGVIGYDRILKMLDVKDGDLMVEEKGIYSIEKFLVARRLMYWQVYLHKTVLGAEKTLIKIIQRAKELVQQGHAIQAASTTFDFFLKNATGEAFLEQQLPAFCMIDDYDVLTTIKNWTFHADTVLSTLCRRLIERRLLKVKLQAEPFDQEWINLQRNNICRQLKINEEDCHYFLFTGEAQNTTYDPTVERINILFKNGTVTDISKVDNALIHQALASPVKKYYICYYNC